MGLYKFMICFCTNLWRQYTFADCIASTQLQCYVCGDEEMDCVSTT